MLRTELEALAARLAAQHAAPEEIRVLYSMIDEDEKWLDDPEEMSRAKKRFHKQLHLASHNRYLIQQLQSVHRSMALMGITSISFEGRATKTLDEHRQIVFANRNLCDMLNLDSPEALLGKRIEQLLAAGKTASDQPAHLDHRLDLVLEAGEVGDYESCCSDDENEEQACCSPSSTSRHIQALA